MVAVYSYFLRMDGWMDDLQFDMLYNCILVMRMIGG